MALGGVPIGGGIAPPIDADSMVSVAPGRCTPDIVGVGPAMMEMTGGPGRGRGGHTAGPGFGHTMEVTTTGARVAVGRTVTVVRPGRMVVTS